MSVTIDLDKLHQHPGHFITVEGGIGAGKSTFVERLAALRSQRGENCMIFPEPVHKVGFRRLLGLYYQDPKRWGLTFQMYALKERLQQHTLAAELAVNGCTVIQDRSIYTDSCFGRLVHADGNMTDDEWEIYADTFGAMKRQLRYPDLVIYLRTSPEVCDQRIRSRSRSEESAIPMDYLRKLHIRHEEFAADMSSITRMLVLDWNNFDQDLAVVDQQINTLLDRPVGFMVRDWNRL